MTTSEWPSETTGIDERVFAEPWQARAFAIVVLLHERGLYSWTEWSEALATRIESGCPDGLSGLDGSYYHHWLDALEDLLTRRGIDPGETERWRDAWRNAARRTPHGNPIEVHAADFGASPPARHGAYPGGLRAETTT